MGGVFPLFDDLIRSFCTLICHGSIYPPAHLLATRGHGLGLKTYGTMGEAAANVRWYVAWVKHFIDEFRLNPDHPSCASILGGAEAVFTPLQTHRRNTLDRKLNKVWLPG